MDQDGNLTQTNRRIQRRKRCVRTNLVAVLLLASVLASCAPASPTAPPEPAVTTHTPLPTHTPDELPLPSPESSQIEITYVGSAGFFISCAGKKILIDALFDGPIFGIDVPQEHLTAMAKAQPPFDHVDLVLASHSHLDHFEPDLVGAHLKSNPQAHFVSTVLAVQHLRTAFPGFAEIEARVHPFDLAKGEHVQTTINGIQLEIINVPHGSMRNLGFIIEVGGLRLFHPGDPDAYPAMVPYLQSYALPEKEIDIALLPWWLVADEELQAIVSEGIRPRDVIVRYSGDTNAEEVRGLLVNVFPQAIVLGVMESWSQEHRPAAAERHP